MEYKKVPQDINDFTNDNLKALSELFPSVIKDGQVDFDALKEELGQFEEVDGEKYELTWSGKQNAKRKAQEKVLGRTLNYIEEDSKNPDTTQNLYIEGDNLEVLKLLRQNYYGSVKMIYIDPPYNTGNDFVYNDNFKMNAKESDIAEGLVSEDGERLQKNLKSTNRYHANWLNMMYPRLKVARDLLTDDGVIFISIDDYEFHNLRRICDEIFEEDNFIGKRPFVWHIPNGTNKGFTARAHEYILSYAKNINLLPPFMRSTCLSSVSIERCTNAPKSMNPTTELVFPKGLKSDIKDGILKGIIGTKEPIEIMGEMVFKNGALDHDVILRSSWRNKNQILDFFSNGFSLDEKNQKIVDVFFDSKGKPKYKKELIFFAPKSIQTFTDSESLFSLGLSFDNPKPLDLCKFFIGLVLEKSDLILDFFSGSATTAHAVMQLNAEDGGNRRFIMVQLPEKCDETSEAYKAGYKNICEIGKERIRRAGERIKEEIEGENGQLKLGEDPKKVPDIGFRVFRTSDTNIRWNLVESDHRQLDLDAIKDNPDVMDFTSNAKDVDVVYEIMLRQKDVPLSQSMEILSHIGSRTYLYGCSHLVCLENEVTEVMVDKLAAIDPLPIKFVFRDSAFKDDISLKDETFRRLEGLIAKNSGDVKKTYTVEFI